MDAELLFTDHGFNGHGEHVRFSDLRGATVNADGSFPVEILVKVPFDRSMLKPGTKVPVMVDVLPPTEPQPMWSSATIAKRPSASWCREHHN